MNSLKSLSNEIAKKLLQIKAIKLQPTNPFTWASGIKSPIYCDNRIALSFPKLRKLMINEFIEHSKKFENAKTVVGVATGGIAWGALVADSLSKPFAYVRPEAKKHGRKNIIEGQVNKNDPILVIEDLISTGKSSLKVVDILRDNGYIVEGMMAIFSYNLDIAKENFDKANCKLTTLTNYDILIKNALETNYILDNDIAVLKKWKTNPSDWKVERK